ncbi:MAG: hypothetical protein AAGH68_09475 [Pseudomonadota bacterium]
MSLDLRFLPWYCRGLSTVIDTVDSDAAPTGYSTTAETEIDGLSGSIQTNVSLYGPGDIEGLGEGQIAAQAPAPGATNIEPNFLVHVDFASADMPWRYTPAQADAQGRLRPWLALIVLRKTETFGIKQISGVPAPFIEAPVAELPDPALPVSALWGHVQVEGPFDETPLAEIVRDAPQRAKARLISPRRLAPNADWMACLVPAFEVGRRAALGQPWDDQTGLAPAWTFDPSSDQHIDLPVFAHWTFSTGARGDFESLARNLEPREMTAAAARRPFVLDPQIAGTGSAEMGLKGALRPVITPAPPGEAASPEVKTTLTDWINRAADVEDAGGDPQTTPPLYGRWHADVRRVGNAAPKWIDELNLDPRNRIVAAAGGDIVQAHQDSFMDMAWEQAGALDAANSLLKNGQLARSVGSRLTEKHIAPLPDAMALKIAGPAHARSRYGDTSLYKSIEDSPVPEASFSSAFRRLSRIRGP